VDIDMLVIRKEQMDVFREAVRRGFEDQMLAHLGEFSPPLVKVTGEEQMRKTIRLGMGRADAYGFTYQGPVRLYLELMLLFGSYFDTDPQYPWAAEILNNLEMGSQMQRADLLYEKTMDYRRQVAGPADAYTLRALRNIQIFARQPLSLPSDNFVSAMQREIGSVYPEKAAFVGAAGLEALIHQGMDLARTCQFLTVRAAALLVVLMLAFGHGCADDPLYPWIGRTLEDAAIDGPAARAKRLEHKALTWLEHVLAYFDKGGQS
jgi:hypothetical protein